MKLSLTHYLSELKGGEYSVASDEEILLLLKALCRIYGTPEGFDISSAIYVELLPYPLSVLNEAVKQHMRTNKWFPKPSELIELCEPRMSEVRWKIADAESDLAYVSQELSTVTREEFYRNQTIGDGYGSAGSSALRATDVLRPIDMLSPERLKAVAESLASRPKIPVPEDAPKEQPEKISQ